MGAVIPGRSTSIVRLDPPWLTGLSFDDVNAVVFRGSHRCCGIASSGGCDVSGPEGGRYSRLRYRQFVTPRQTNQEAYREPIVAVIVPTEMLAAVARKLLRGPQPISEKGFEGPETRDEGTLH